MSIKKDLRADDTYFITKDKGCNPKLGAKVLKDGIEHLFLDYYLGYEKTYNVKIGKEVVKPKRKREYLPQMFLIRNPTTPKDRQNNKDILALAKSIREKKQQELIS